ncbi:MAG: AEC family transporter [Oscillibacter sp.]
MNSFWVALRVVAPMALLMGIGVLVRKVRIVEPDTMRQMDKLTFRLFMPTLLFSNIYRANLAEQFSAKLVGFAAIGLAAVFALALLLPSRLEPDHNRAASIGQAMIRSNYILFGVAVAESLYGDGQAATVALLGTLVVPLSNALAVVILEINRSGKANPGKIVLAIFKNPMVIAALLAVTLQLLHLRLPGIAETVVDDLAGVTTTLSFISLGVSLNLGEMQRNRRPLAVGILLRMLLVPLIFLPITLLLGFRGQEFCALLVLFAAPAAVASYPMAVAMGADGPLSGQLVVFTTIISIFTMFAFTFLFDAMGIL